MAWEALVAQPVPADLTGLDDVEQKTLAANVDKLPAKMAPLVYDGKVIVGVTSAGYGIYYNIFGGTREGKAPPAQPISESAVSSPPSTPRRARNYGAGTARAAKTGPAM